MSNQMEKYINELSEIINIHLEKDGSYTTEVPSLYFYKVSTETEPRYASYKTSFCFVVQGEKEILLGQEYLRYGVGDYLITSIDIPVIAKISKAPYVSLRLEFSLDQILHILNKLKKHPVLNKKNDKPILINKINQQLLDALVRLVSLVNTPEDIPTLAPLFTEEILYRILQGNLGANLEQITIKGSKSYLVRNVIRKITENFNQPIKIEELAKIANISPASLHRYFKEVTAMSPIQFQKQIRLQEAKRILISEPKNVAEVAFQVGYESTSQFSREYSRMFGFSPIEDIKNFRKNIFE